MGTTWGRGLFYRVVPTVPTLNLKRDRYIAISVHPIHYRPERLYRGKVGPGGDVGTDCKPFKTGASIMTAIELARLVIDMRATQKAYFKERTISLLDESRRKERELDKVLKEITEDRPAMLAGFDR
jgi:hypothetical protein